MNIANGLALHLHIAISFTLLTWSNALFAIDLGLPDFTPPAYNLPTQAKIALGRRLFHDKRLSSNGSISCASCHVPSKAFTDGLPVAKGIFGKLGTRNTPTLLNVAFERHFFWDGRRSSLEDQAKDPFINLQEHGFKTHAQVIAIIRADSAYRQAFKQAFSVFPMSITIDQVVLAIASYERTLIAADSPFDRYQYGGNKMAMSQAAIRGLNLFEGQAKCVTCHRIDGTFAILTDNQFHSLGIGHTRIAPRLAEITTRFVQQQNKTIDQSILSDADISELGRFVVTLNPADISKFRTPSLRNVALTAPYMHDGSVATLEDAVDLEIYYHSAESNQPLILTPQERADLIAFLDSLTSSHLQVKHVR